jgi:hypothetical protein
MTHQHDDAWLQASVDLIHEQRHDQPPDHAKVGEDLVYDPTCPVCREVTAQRPPNTLPAWLEGHLDRVAAKRGKETP